MCLYKLFCCFFTAEINPFVLSDKNVQEKPVLNMNSMLDYFKSTNKKMSRKWLEFSKDKWTSYTPGCSQGPVLSSSGDCSWGVQASEGGVGFLTPQNRIWGLISQTEFCFCKNSDPEPRPQCWEYVWVSAEAFCWSVQRSGVVTLKLWGILH